MNIKLIMITLLVGASVQDVFAMQNNTQHNNANSTQGQQNIARQGYQRGRTKSFDDMNAYEAQQKQQQVQCRLVAIAFDQAAALVQPMQELSLNR